MKTLIVLFVICTSLLSLETETCPALTKYSELKGEKLEDSLSMQKNMELSLPTVKKVLDDIFRAEQGYSNDVNVSKYITRAYIQEKATTEIYGALMAIYYMSADGNMPYSRDIRAIYNAALSEYREKIVSGDKHWCKTKEYIAFNPKNILASYGDLKGFESKAKAFKLPAFFELNIYIKDSEGTVVDLESQMLKTCRMEKFREIAVENGFDNRKLQDAVLAFAPCIDVYEPEDESKASLLNLEDEKYQVYYENKRLNFNLTIYIDLTKEASVSYVYPIDINGSFYFVESELREVFVKDGI